MADFNLSARIEITQIDPGNKLRQLAAQLASVNKQINSSNLGGIGANFGVLASSAQLANAQLGAIVKNTSKLTAQTNRATTAQKNLSKTTKESVSNVQDFADKAGLALRRFTAFSIAAGGVFGSLRGIVGATKDALAFERQLLRVTQVTKSLGDSLNDIGTLRTGIRALAEEYGASSTELVTAAKTFAQAGLSLKEVQSALTAVARSDLLPTFNSISETSEGLIAIYRQFGLESKDFTTAIAQINAVSGQFAVESSDLIKAVQRAGGVFNTASAGVGTATSRLAEFLALVTSVRATTRESAETIGTGLRTIIGRLQRPENIEFFESLGVQLENAEGQFVGATRAIEGIGRVISALPERSTALAEIVERFGGLRQLSRAIPLLTESTTRTRALQAAQQGLNSTQDDVGQAFSNLTVQLTQLNEQFRTLIADILQTDSFQALAKSAVTLASSIISVGDALKEVIPLAITLAGIKFGAGFIGGGGLGQFTRRVVSNQPPVIRSRTSGKVGGSGSGDIIPAMLEPGEFVLRKSAVNALGTETVSRLNNIRGFRKGGLIPGFQRGGSPNKNDNLLSLISSFIGGGNIGGSSVDGVVGGQSIKVELDSEKLSNIQSSRDGDVRGFTQFDRGGSPVIGLKSVGRELEDVMGTLRHEAVHLARNFGFINDEDFRGLATALGARPSDNRAKQEEFVARAIQNKVPLKSLGDSEADKRIGKLASDIQSGAILRNGVATRSSAEAAQNFANNSRPGFEDSLGRKDIPEANLQARNRAAARSKVQSPDFDINSVTDRLTRDASGRFVQQKSADRARSDRARSAGERLARFGDNRFSEVSARKAARLSQITDIRTGSSPIRAALTAPIGSLPSLPFSGTLNRPIGSFFGGGSSGGAGSPPSNTPSGPGGSGGGGRRRRRRGFGRTRPRLGGIGSTTALFAASAASELLIPDELSGGRSVLSGALGGAATGASFGGPVGAGVGAVVGGVGAFASERINQQEVAAQELLTKSTKDLSESLKILSDNAEKSGAILERDLIQLISGARVNQQNLGANQNAQGGSFSNFFGSSQLRDRNLAGESFFQTIGGDFASFFGGDEGAASTGRARQGRLNTLQRSRNRSIASANDGTAESATAFILQELRKGRSFSQETADGTVISREDRQVLAASVSNRSELAQSTEGARAAEALRTLIPELTKQAELYNKLESAQNQYQTSLENVSRAAQISADVFGIFQQELGAVNSLQGSIIGGASGNFSQATGTAINPFANVGALSSEDIRTALGGLRNSGVNLGRTTEDFVQAGPAVSRLNEIITEASRTTGTDTNQKIRDAANFALDIEGEVGSQISLPVAKLIQTSLEAGLNSVDLGGEIDASKITGEIQSAIDNATAIARNAQAGVNQRRDFISSSANERRGLLAQGTANLRRAREQRANNTREDASITGRRIGIQEGISLDSAPFNQLSDGSIDPLEIGKTIANLQARRSAIQERVSQTGGTDQDIKSLSRLDNQLDNNVQALRELNSGVLGLKEIQAKLAQIEERRQQSQAAVGDSFFASPEERLQNLQGIQAARIFEQSGGDTGALAAAGLTRDNLRTGFELQLQNASSEDQDRIRTRQTQLLGRGLDPALQRRLSQGFDTFSEQGQGRNARGARAQLEDGRQRQQDAGNVLQGLLDSSLKNLDDFNTKAFAGLTERLEAVGQQLEKLKIEGQITADVNVNIKGIEVLNEISPIISERITALINDKLAGLSGGLPTE